MSSNTKTEPSDVKDGILPDDFATGRRIFKPETYNLVERQSRRFGFRAAVTTKMMAGDRLYNLSSVDVTTADEGDFPLNGTNASAISIEVAKFRGEDAPIRDTKRWVGLYCTFVVKYHDFPRTEDEKAKGTKARQVLGWDVLPGTVSDKA